jgi:hypothetical protein
MYKIAIITCWYGAYPWYFPYFIHSCCYNPTIDFIIITDNTETIPCKPENVKIIYKSLDTLNSLVRKKMKFPVNINNPYKLNDFKPAYGFILSRIIRGYDFWGYADIDVMYGDIRGFMTDELLSSHDVLSSRHDYMAGTFSMFKNVPWINTLFMRSRDYKKVFQSDEHYCFDECNNLFPELDKGYSVLDFPDKIQSITYVVKKAEAEGKLKAYFDFIVVDGVPGRILWKNGKVFYKNMYEIMYYNLIRFKRECKMPKVFNPMPTSIYFTPSRIIANKIL